MAFVGTIIFDPEPERECWHEAAHAVVAHHFGMRVIAIGYSWVNGKDKDPNPSCWIPTDGFDKESRATELFAGVAAEVVKLGQYDIFAYRDDRRIWLELGCSPSADQYIQKAIDILKERDAALVRVYNRLMEERVNPSYPPFQDTEDLIWKQRHLTQDDFETLMSQD